MLKWFISVFFALPILLSSLASLYFINYGPSFKVIPYFLIACSAIIILSDFFLHRKLTSNYLNFSPLPRLTENIIYFSGIVLICLCIFDLFFHGVVILDPNPELYFTFTPMQRHLRHFTSLVWILAPIAFFINSKKMKAIFILSAIVFPILFMDRNRFLFTIFSMSATLLLFKIAIKDVYIRTFLAVIIACSGLFTFAVLGKLRSGDSAIDNIYSVDRGTQFKTIEVSDVAKNTNCELPKLIPLDSSFSERTSIAKWLILYVSSPLFNLAGIEQCNFRNDILLKSQLLPFQPKILIAAHIPLTSPYLNVATELLPFYTFGGLGLSSFIIILTFFILAFLLRRLTIEFNIFYYLIFLRFAYCALFFNFAPQFYTWVSIGFVSVILSVKYFVQFAESGSLRLLGITNDSK